MKITPHIHFEGTCREAMEFYKSCLGGKVEFNTVGEIPDDAKADMRRMMPGIKVDDSRIMHASLEKDSITIITASDMMDPKSFTKGDTMTVGVDCSSEKEIRDIYNKLSAGGKIQMELGDAFWGSIFASFTDKFGVDWMLNYSKPKN